MQRGAACVGLAMLHDVKLLAFECGWDGVWQGVVVVGRGVAWLGGCKALPPTALVGGTTSGCTPVGPFQAHPPGNGSRAGGGGTPAQGLGVQPHDPHCLNAERGKAKAYDKRASCAAYSCCILIKPAPCAHLARQHEGWRGRLLQH